MIPDDKEAISTPTPQPKLPVLDGTALAQSKQRTLLTTSDYLSARASCQAVNSPDSRLQLQMWLFFDRHRRMSDFTGTDRREGGREEMEGIGRWK